MILRPLEPAPAASQDFLPAWQVVERIQKQTHESCWMITQPSHAALSGELAANFSMPAMPSVDQQLVRAIALHDAGWGMADAQAILQSRMKRPSPPESFIEMPVPRFLAAWQKSIETAQSVSPSGGYIVSRHFYRLAKHRAGSVEDTKADRQKLQAFMTGESQRQEKLVQAAAMSNKQLELLTDLLQFCDLLSLYICCGASDNVIFPEWFGVQVRITNKEEGLKLDPAVIKPDAAYAIAALRYPAAKGLSSQEIRVKIGS